MIPEMLRLEELLREVLQVALGEVVILDPDHDLVRLAADLHLVTEVSRLSVHLDPLVQEFLLSNRRDHVEVIVDCRPIQTNFHPPKPNFQDFSNEKITRKSFKGKKVDGTDTHREGKEKRGKG